MFFIPFKHFILLTLQVLSNFFYQLRLRNWYAHNLIIPFGIYQEHIADDLDELAIIYFGNKDCVEV